jgi:hypothetical protein
MRSGGQFYLNGARVSTKKSGVKMNILFSSHTGTTLREWANKGYAIGNLFSPSSRKTAPNNIYCLDNGAFICYKNQQEFDFDYYFAFIDRWMLRNNSKPEWIIVPDTVGDKKKTLENWNKYEPELRRYNVPLAIAVQDGMTKEDIPKTADVIFVGGTTQWKIETIPYWAINFNRVHVGRVNDWRRLWFCYKHGIESVDGTGYFRKGVHGQPAVNAHLFLRWQAGYINKTMGEIWSLSPSGRLAILNQSLGIKSALEDLPLFSNPFLSKASG